MSKFQASAHCKDYIRPSVCLCHAMLMALCQVPVVPVQSTLRTECLNSIFEDLVCVCIVMVIASGLVIIVSGWCVSITFERQCHPLRQQLRQIERSLQNVYIQAGQAAPIWDLKSQTLLRQLPHVKMPGLSIARNSASCSVQPWKDVHLGHCTDFIE